jgi:hypothetical protein
MDPLSKPSENVVLAVGTVTLTALHVVEAFPTPSRACTE